MPLAGGRGRPLRGDKHCGQRNGTCEGPEAGVASAWSRNEADEGEDGEVRPTWGRGQPQGAGRLRGRLAAVLRAKEEPGRTGARWGERCFRSPTALPRPWSRVSVSHAAPHAGTPGRAGRVPADHRGVARGPGWDPGVAAGRWEKTEKIRVRTGRQQWITCPRHLSCGRCPHKRAMLPRRGVRGGSEPSPQFVTEAVLDEIVRKRTRSKQCPTLPSRG